MSLIGNYPEAMPHDRLNIFDQSGYIENIPSEVIKNPTACIPFISPKGVGADNQFVMFNDPDSILAYGTPNMAKYGVSLYLLHQYLKGKGSVLGMRLMPANATHANLVLLVQHKVLEDQPELNAEGKALYLTPEGDKVTEATGNTAIVRDVLDFKYSVASISGTDAVSVESIKAKMETLATTVADGNGYKTSPLCAFISKPKGAFAKNYAVRLSADPTMELMVANNRFYRMTLLENSTVVGKPVSFSLAESLFGNESMQLQDSVDLYSNHVTAVMSKHYDETIIPLLTTIVGAEKVNLVDILFGISKDDEAEYNLKINPASVSLSIGSGVRLDGGSDGSFGDVNPFTEYDKEFLKFFKGEIDSTINNTVRRPFRHLFDVSESIEVKNAMLALSDRRHSTIAYLSGPINHMTYTETLAFRASSIRYDGFRGVLYPESAIIADAFTGKKVRMPSSYFQAYAVAMHCQDNNFSKPFYGEKNNFQWTGYLRGSLRPQTQDPDIFTALHKARINQMVEVADSVAQPYQQITMQSAMSSLSEINNIHILFEMVDIALNYSKANRGSDNETKDIADFVTGLNTIITDRLRGILGELSIVAEQEAANGAGANRIRCRFDVRFKYQLKGVSYEFYIH